MILANCEDGKMKKLKKKSKFSDQVHLFYALPVLLLLPTHVPSLPMPQSYSLENEYPDIEPK